MAKDRRSPFGELLHTWRTRLNLTQGMLSARANEVASSTPEAATVSERTIAALEHRSADPAGWVSPRPATVATLARVFGLEPGTSDYRAFVEASRFRSTLEAPEHQPPAWTRVLRDDSTPSDDVPFFAPEGREPQLERLQRLIERALDGTPGAAFVRAPAGTGKTSLVAHAVRQALAAHPGLVVLWGESPDRAVTAGPYGPIRQILGIVTGDPAAAGPGQLLTSTNERRIRARIPHALRALADEADGFAQAYLPPHVVDAHAAQGVISPALHRRLQRLIEAPLADQIDFREQLFRLLARYTEAGPVIVVVEDLHWATPGRVSLLTHALQRLRDRALPVLLIGTYRPLATGPDIEPHPLHGMLTTVSRLYPDPIIDLSSAVGGAPGRAFVDALTRRRYGDHVSREFRDALFAQTGGLPLFVVGMMRWFQANGVEPASGEGGAWDPARGALPSEIDALFAEQVGQLRREVRAFLEMASVQGDRFFAEVTMQALGLSRAALADILDDTLTQRFGLLRDDGITETAGQRWHTYRFAHGLLRDYLYRRMTPLQQETRHLATAEALVALRGDGPHETSSTIATHFDRGGDPVRAARAYLLAGNHAMEQSRYRQGAWCFERPEVLDVRHADPFTYAQSFVGRGNCARGMGRNDEAVLHFERALDVARRLHVPLVEANAETSRAMLDFDSGQMHEGSARLQRAIAILEAQGQADEAARALALLSHTLLGSGRYGEAFAAAERAVAIADTQPDDMLVVVSLTALANAWMEVGHYRKAITLYQRAIALCEDHHHTHRANVCWLNLALCHIDLGEPDAAATAIDATCAPGRRVIARLRGTCHFNSGLLAELRGDADGAAHQYQESLEIRERLGQQALAVDSLGGLLRAAVMAGNRRGIYRYSLEIQRRTRERGLEGIEHVGRMFVALVEADLAVNDQECARVHGMQALAEISRRATTLPDPTLRESYLHRVPAHRRLHELTRGVGLTLSVT